MQEQTTEQIVNQFMYKIERMKPYTDLVGEANLSALREQVQDLQRNASDALNENRLLRIGVIGQIKRGKSTFINALLFDGENILPKAASPMTAALTRIQYGEKLEATVDFYTPDEWRQVEATAEVGFKKKRLRQEAKGGLNQNTKGSFLARGGKSKKSAIMPGKPTPDEQACMELVEMAQQGGEDITKYLGSSKMLDTIDNMSQLNAILSDYIGVGGRFTPIVKSSRLTLNMPVLKNIEIIDTPGINDPIVSRSRVTQQFMGQCDVIFFLSNCGQFLDQADMRLLAQNIPAKGIDDIYLIGSLFDSVLLDDGHKYASIGRAVSSIVTKLSDRATNDFKQICREIEEAGEQAYMAVALDKALPPYFISAMAFNIYRHWEALDEGEEKILKSLQKMFPQDTLTRETLLELANLQIIRSHLKDVEQHKDKIFHGKLEKLLERFEPAFRAELRELRAEVIKEKETLETGTIEELSTHLKILSSNLEKGKNQVALAFEAHTNHIKKSMSTLRHEIKSAALDARKVSRRKGTETQEEAYTVDKGMGFAWWRSLTGNRYETRHRDITVSYSYASVHDAIDKVEGFISGAKEKLDDKIGEVVDIEGLRLDILEAVKEIVNIKDGTMDSDGILALINKAVSRIKNPRVDLNTDRFLKEITKVFNSPEVRDSDIEKLQSSMAKAVNKALEAIEGAVTDNQEKICAELSKTGNDFIDGITSELNSKITRMEKSKGNLLQEIERYNQLLELI
ncbi:dynamin family protein [Desulfoluna sp.]|uniref:dynamin family protein n=1 Tax=Desulfoluna sp. TaxID=2045199 RepID=UPI00260E368B|nr:dynamin family protein [Desulfoluna sp.]